jgi:hypothetical protein
MSVRRPQLFKRPNFCMVAYAVALHRQNHPSTHYDGHVKVGVVIALGGDFAEDVE